MSPRRKKSHGDGKVESQANPDEGSTSKFAKPVYLVAEHEGEQTAYSVLKIDAGGGGKPRLVQTVAGLPGTARGMSFVAAHSKHGSWIVGVGGGLRAGTIIFEPNTLKTYTGPRFLHPKSDPIVISHGGEVYALSRRPRVVPLVDFEPWFHSLSFKEGVPVGGGGGPIYWCKLPPPPFFPSQLNPYQFRDPPEISVTSYAALGSYILLSAEQAEPIVLENLGTYAFHVVNKTWEKVHPKNLPFVGQAVPIGGSLFVACPVNNGVTAASASLFHISLDASSSTLTLATSLWIQEFPVTASEGKIPRPLICPLGRGTFCSIMLRSTLRCRRKPNCSKVIMLRSPLRCCRKPNCSKAIMLRSTLRCPRKPNCSKVILTTFEVENIDAILTACQSKGLNAKDLSQWK